jgi:hypothetical protein
MPDLQTDTSERSHFELAGIVILVNITDLNDHFRTTPGLIEIRYCHNACFLYVSVMEYIILATEVYLEREVMRIVHSCNFYLSNLALQNHAPCIAGSYMFSLNAAYYTLG